MLQGVVIRMVAVLTVLLSLGLMAVSAYAAKTAPPRDVVDITTESEATATEDGDLGGGVAGIEVPDLSDPVRIYPPTPTVELRYEAPADDASASTSPGGRDNLSPGVRTWQVVSLRPGAIDPSRLARSGVDIPADQLGVMLEVGYETDIPWQILAAVAKIESDFGQNMATSSAGAIGYGQFLPSTWELYGQGGDPYSFHDVIPAMGRFLLDGGAPGDIPTALYAYNHSWPYVAQVLSFAASLGEPGLENVPRGLTEGLIWPVVGPISSYFGPEHPLGIDIDQTMAPGTAVLASHSGVVLFAGGDPCCSYGHYVILASATGLTTLYAHFDLLAVETGQTVRQGEPLGIVGNTGYSTGTHLHFEVIDGGYRRDPLAYLP